MGVLTYEQFIPPLLKVLGEHPDGIRTAEAFEAAANAVGLSAEDRAEVIPSGSQALYRNRIGWAHDSLKRVGWSSSPQFGVWQITPAGKAALASHPHGFTPEETRQIAKANASVRMADIVAGHGPEPVAARVSPESTPDDLIETALEQIRASVAADLLERVRQVTPDRFESLVLDLLHALGYGESRTDLQRVGGSGDGGIDGVISLDKLGLQKVYVQAKRWASAVGSPEIQTFMGALQLQGADRGVIITSGEFSRPARDTALRAKGTIVLVDGKMLTRLMVEHEVGVTHKALRVPRVDGDLFED